MSIYIFSHHSWVHKVYINRNLYCVARECFFFIVKRDHCVRVLFQVNNCVKIIKSKACVSAIFIKIVNSNLIQHA